MTDDDGLGRPPTACDWLGDHFACEGCGCGCHPRPGFDPPPLLRTNCPPPRLEDR